MPGELAASFLGNVGTVSLLADFEVGPAAFVSRVVHLLGAILLGGAVFYLRMVYLRARRSLPDEQQTQFWAAVRGPLAALVGASVALILITGLFTYVYNIRNFQMSPAYHQLFGAKFLLGLVVFYATSLIAGRSAAAERMRGNMATWLSICAVLIVVIVVIGSVMRYSDRPPREEPEAVGSRQWAEGSRQ